MNFKATIKGKTIEVKSSMPIDNYGKYLNKFLDEIKGIISAEALLNTITPLLDLKSWRLLNREMRRACDQYCSDNNIMNHATYQAKFFYEGTMIGRTTYGKDAPWADGKSNSVTPVKKSSSGRLTTAEPKQTINNEKASKSKSVDLADVVKVSITKPSKSDHKSLEQLFNEKDPWALINYPIAKRLAVETN